MGKHGTLTTRAATALALAALLSGCALTQKGGLETDAGRAELADLADVSQLACLEAAHAVDEDAIKIDAALSLLHAALVEQRSLASVQAGLVQIGLNSAWAARVSTLYSIGLRRLQAHVGVPKDVAIIADTVIRACRDGVSAAGMVAGR